MNGLLLVVWRLSLCRVELREKAQPSEEYRPKHVMSDLEFYVTEEARAKLNAVHSAVTHELDFALSGFVRSCVALLLIV